MVKCICDSFIIGTKFKLPALEEKDASRTDNASIVLQQWMGDQEMGPLPEHAPLVKNIVSWILPQNKRCRARRQR